MMDRHARKIPGGTAQQPGVSRRTLARTTAWAAPVLVSAVAAPAYAASRPCTDYGVHQVTTDPGKVTSLVFKPSTVTATVTYTACRDNNPNATPSSQTGQPIHTAYYPGFNCIELHHAAGMAPGDTVTMTIAFSSTVRNATLTLTDLDKESGSWSDQVVVQPVGFVASNAGSYVIGSGSASDPFRSSHNGEVSSAQGDVTLTWPSSLHQITITYQAADSDNCGSKGQYIGVGKVGFNNC